MKLSTRLAIYVFLVAIMPKGMGIAIGKGLTGPGITFWELSAIVLLSIPLLKILRMGEFKLDRSNLIISLLIIMPIGAALLGGVGKTGLKNVIFRFVYYFLPFFGAKYFIRNDDEVLKFFRILGVCSIIIAIIAGIEFCTKQSFFESLGFLAINSEAKWENSQEIGYRENIFRPIASFGQGIYLGVFFGLTVLINIFVLFFSRIHTDFRVEILLLLQLFLSFIGIIMSQSRTAMIAVVIIVCMQYIFGTKIIGDDFKKITILIGLALIFLLAAFQLFPSYFDEYLYTNFTSPLAPINLISRGNTFVVGLENVSEEMPFWGYKEPSYILDFYLRKYDLTNGFLFVFLVSGVFYGIIHILLWLEVFVKSYAMRRHSKYGFLVFLVIIYLFIVNNITTLYFQNEIFFYLFGGLACNPFLKERHLGKQIKYSRVLHKYVWGKVR